MPRIEEILQVAMDARASDIHLTAGLPPKMRVNGHLLNMDFTIMKPEDTLAIVAQIMTDEDFTFESESIRSGFTSVTREISSARTLAIRLTPS